MSSPNDREMVSVAFKASLRERDDARALASALNLSLEDYLRRALRIVNAETASLLNTRRN